MALSPWFLSIVAAAAIDAKVTKVTVYSDRARVTRGVQLAVDGQRTVEFPLLPDSVDRATIQVEGSGADIVRVDIGQVEPGEAAFPVEEAKKILADLDRLDDQIALLSSQKETSTSEVAALRGLNPALRDEPLRPAPKLNPAGWNQGIGFLEARLARANQKAQELSIKLRQLSKERDAVVQRASQIGGARRVGGIRTTALVSGHGTAKLSLSYVVTNARWYPSYDLQYLPDQGKVSISFAGLVSQESGEAWEDAALVLSTAEPAHPTELPKLATWKIGEKERFIPTPVPKPQPPPPPPPPAYGPKAKPTAQPAEEIDAIKQRLIAKAGAPSAALDQFDQSFAMGGVASGAGQAAPSRPSKKSKRMRAPSAPPAETAQAPRAMMAPAAPMMPAPEAEEEMPADAKSAAGGLRAAPNHAPESALALAPSPGYQPPPRAADLPVSLAGGYDLHFDSARPETIESGSGARRVALFTQTWPVSVERALYPALAPSAYLVAEVKTPSKTPLPGGAAKLFVGDDPSGTTQLTLMAPGQTFTLPLGLDPALHPVRQVKLVEGEQGFIGKDEVNEYLVTIELANPYRIATPIQIYDQLPVTDDKEVEIRLLEAKPPVTPEEVTGKLTWSLSAPPSGKVSISYRYSIRRPKGYLLRQQP